jgi:hypothetical protein
MKRLLFSLAAAVALLVAALTAGAASASTASARAAAPPSAGGAGSGHAAAARVVNVRDLPSAPRAANVAPQNPVRTPATGTSLPSRPTTGHRPVLPGGQPASATPQLASGTVTGIPGINLASSFCSTCAVEPDFSAAVSSSQLVEVAGLGIQVLNKSGLNACGGPTVRSLSDLFLNGGTGFVTRPWVQYDNTQHHFILTAIASPANTTPAIWVAASINDDACGPWFVYRIAFSGPAWPVTGTQLLNFVPGQDTNALLIGISDLVPGTVTSSVFGIAKSQLYFGSAISFSTFSTASLASPATNAGFPMISTPFSYFLSMVSDTVSTTGYQLYRLTNSGGPGATLTPLAAIVSPFSGPTRSINQPGMPAGVFLSSPSDISSPPVNDGTRIWFTHDVDANGFPTVRYGNITIASNTVAVNVAYHSGTSDDFNPSIGVGIGFSGAETIYLNWAYTDSPAGVPVSDTVDSYQTTTGQVPFQAGADVPVVNGTVETQPANIVGLNSSVDIDPSVIDGSCAVAAQQFYTSNAWNTEISKIGNC